MEYKSVESDLDSIVFPTRYNPSAIWSEPDGIDTSAVTFVCVDTPFSSDIPNL